MSTRRTMLTAGPALAVLGSARAQTKSDATNDEIVALFVQSAKSMEFATDTKLVKLHGVSPQTIFFSDRPERIAGNMKSEHFVSFWNEAAKDSFQKNPPNADISYFDGGQMRQVVAEISNPRMEGDIFNYTIRRVLEGTFPPRANDVAVFIDVIGMPLTPLSYAGVARRARRRAFYYR
jgi:hypothetical protein